jgi:hypothetical protein
VSAGDKKSIGRRNILAVLFVRNAEVDGARGAFRASTGFSGDLFAYLAALSCGLDRAFDSEAAKSRLRQAKVRILTTKTQNRTASQERNEMQMF